MRGDYWLFIAILILIVSLALHQVPLALVSMLFLLTGGISRLWNRYCLHRVEYRRSLSQSAVFFGEEIIFEIELTNRKPLPLPWLQIDDELPEHVTLLKGKAEDTIEGRVLLSNIFPINMYHRVKRRFPMRCSRRGSFVFGPTRIRSGDLFGFFRRERIYEKLDYLMVYPRLVSLDSLGIPSRQFFGDIRLKRHIFQDPVLTAGVRDYVSGDSLKRIHWKTTARLGRLQTKVFEPTTTVDISLFLDVRTLKAPLWGSSFQLQELGIIAAAAIARHALEGGFRVGLYVNQITRFSRGMVRVPHSQHPDQLVRILEALAQLHQVETIPIARFIRQEAGTLPWGSTVMVISAHPADELLATLLELKRVGRSVALVKVGGDEPLEAGGSLTVYHISDSVAWDVVQQIGLSEE
ncbi:MAG: hypothetical protein A2Z29_09705 [Chloroflexi bacterium RBG_16_56_11]|nr:MAG: hypothetical protein A2Z29_09705 [Chloroflexi bacterium RBG_16_56_11]